LVPKRESESDYPDKWAICEKIVKKHQFDLDSVGDSLMLNPELGGGDCENIDLNREWCPFCWVWVCSLVLLGCQWLYFREGTGLLGSS